MIDHGIIFEVNGVKKHSMLDFGLILSPKEIPYPEVKEEYVDVVGADGSLDLTECYGRIFYRDRKFKLSFSCDPKNYETAIKKVAAFLHGKKVKMTFWDDELFYFIGRVNFNKYASNKGLGILTMDITTSPYKYRQLKTIVINEVKNKAIINYANDRMEAVPTFKVSAAMNFNFEGNNYALGTGETIFPNVIFKQGDNVIEWTGNGTVEVSYQEGAL